MSVAAMIDALEATGAMLRLDGQKVRVRYPDEKSRRELANQIALLREQRDEVVALLRVRNVIPAMPPGVCLVEWKLKKPPVAIETCAIVTDPDLFARCAVEELRKALAQPNGWFRWSVPQLIDRLAQVGVRVALETRQSSEPVERA